MSVNLHIHRVDLHTSAGVSEYEFDRGVNAVVGSYGTGKSSLLELIKFSLGGEAKIMPTIREHVSRVRVEATLGSARVSINRQMGRGRLDVEFADGTESEVWSAQRGRNNPASIRLLQMLGLPEARLPRRTGTASSEPLSFFDYYRYVYLPQTDVDTSVAGHADPFLDRKRKAVFALAYGLADPRLQELEVEQVQLEKERDKAQIEADAVRDFLDRTGSSDEREIEELETQARRTLRDANRQFENLRRDLRRSTPDQREIRDEVASLRLTLSDAMAERDAAQASISKYESIIAQLDLDIQRHEKGNAAVASLSRLEFTTCPRCLQRVDDRLAYPNTCILCTQPEPSHTTPDDRRLRRHAERRARLMAQRAEAEQLLSDERNRLAAAHQTVVDIRSQLDDKSSELERLSFSIVSPSFDEGTRLAAAVERARSQLDTIGRARELWAAYREKESILQDYNSRIAACEAAQRPIRQELEANQSRVSALSEAFDQEIAALQWAGYRTASVDRDTYLPIINGHAFDDLSVAGARKTLANVAYYIANLATCLSDRNILLPNLLIIDSPRKSLGNTPEDINAGRRIYYRLSVLLDTSKLIDFLPSVQVIVADNGLPPGLTRRERPERIIELSYERPLLRGISHPGQGNVETVGG